MGMKNKNANMLLRIAQADAFALAFEFVKEQEHPDLKKKLIKFDKFCKNPRYKSLKPGFYSDDTQMSIAVAETLMFSSDPSSDCFLEHFFNAFKRDERDGYSRGLQKIFEASGSVEEFKHAIVPLSNKNGAAMRAVPIGARPDISEVLSLSEKSAICTHNTPGGIISSKFVSALSHFSLFTDFRFSDFESWFAAETSSTFPKYVYEPWSGFVCSDHKDEHDLGLGINTVKAVYTLLCEKESLHDIMKQIIEWGGDTDSVAAIAWGIASARYQDEILPEFLERDLEKDGKFGVEFLKNMGKLLMDFSESKK